MDPLVRSRQEHDGRGDREQREEHDRYGDPAETEQPSPASTGIHAHADRQIRSVASAVVAARIGAPTITQSFTSGLPSPRSELERSDRDRTADEGDDRQVDVVALKGRRVGLGDRARRQIAEARRERGRIREGANASGGSRRSGAAIGHSLAVEDRHARLPAWVVHRPECTPEPRLGPAGDCGQDVRRARLVGRPRTRTDRGRTARDGDPHARIRRCGAAARTDRRAAAQRHAATVPSPRTPASVNAVAIVLLALGGAIEGYAVALAAGTADTPGQSQSLVWALVGVVIILTAWGIRLGQWWAASTAVAVSLVGVALGGYGGLALATGLYGGQTRLTLIGLLAIGAASIVILGLIATAWPWFSMPQRSTRATDSAS